MDANSILYYGNRTVMQTIEGLTEAQMAVGGVCGTWSVADILAHLDSYEIVLAEVLNSILTPGAVMPTLMEMGQQREDFNDLQVAKYKGQSPNQVLESYQTHFQRAAGIARRIPADTWAENGTIPWYGDDYALDDMIVYMFYGHKREHMAQVAVYRDTLK